jgi:hypothetical protein
MVGYSGEKNRQQPNSKSYANYLRVFTNGLALYLIIFDKFS